MKLRPVFLLLTSLFSIHFVSAQFVVVELGSAHENAALGNGIVVFEPSLISSPGVTAPILEALPFRAYLLSHTSSSLQTSFLSQASFSPSRSSFLLADTILISEDAEMPQRHSPAKAAWRSAVLPGWGQIYNDKYWKLPIVYGGLAGLGTWVSYNVYWYRQYRDGIDIKQSMDTTLVDPFPFLTEGTLKLRRENFRRNVDASILLTTAFYLLHIVDAVVDAHLYEFDISDDLSIRVQPNFQNGISTTYLEGNWTASLSLSLQFR